RRSGRWKLHPRRKRWCWRIEFGAPAQAEARTKATPLGRVDRYSKWYALPGRFVALGVGLDQLVDSGRGDAVGTIAGLGMGTAGPLPGQVEVDPLLDVGGAAASHCPSPGRKSHPPSARVRLAGPR